MKPEEAILISSSRDAHISFRHAQRLSVTLWFARKLEGPEAASMEGIAPGNFDSIAAKILVALLAA